MKKLKFLAFAITATLTSLIIVASCAKQDKNPTANWTCKCNVSTGGVTTEIDIPINMTPKDDATTQCAAKQNLYNSSGTGASCVLN